MRAYHLLHWERASLLLLVLLAVLVGGCSLPFTSNSSTSTSVTACSSPLAFQTTSGTIQSISGTTLLIASSNGSTVKAAYTSTTRFVRQALVTTAALREGSFVVVAVTQNASNTYTATTISLSTAANAGSRPRGSFGGSGQGSGSGSACSRQGMRLGAGNRTPRSGNGTPRGVIGTVSQFSGNRLTVADANQTDHAITVNPATQILQTSQVAATSLQVGMRVNLVGLPNSQRVLTAQSVTILPPGLDK
jgi:Domain of unknown function (DUF5666)